MSGEQYDWEPGDVAMVRKADYPEEERLAFRGRGGWTVPKESGYTEFFAEHHFISARPLLVVDDRNIDQMTDVIGAFRRHGYVANLRGPGPRASIEKAVQSLLKQPLPPPAPPKPAEPAGLGAVVTDACGVHYVRTETDSSERRWRRQAHGDHYTWREIDVPDIEHVLSEGLHLDSDLGVSAP